MDTPSCNCHRCRDERAEGQVIQASWGLLHLGANSFVTCPLCGNKRCPKATDHRNECTGSNEPGQKGSIYGGLDTQQ